jgi:hypothetical protein
VFNVARARLGMATALGAGILLAIAPLHVWYAQEARPYAALEFYSLLSLVFFLRLLERPSVLALVGFAVANALNAYNHLFGLFPWLVELVVALGLLALGWIGRTPERLDAPSRRRIVASLGIASAGSLVLMIPILPGLLSYAVDQGNAPSSPIAVDLRFVTELLAGFGAGYSWPILVFTGFALVGAAVSIARRQAIGVTAVAWIVLPIVALAAFSPGHGFVNRYVMFMVPVYLLLVAHGVVLAATFANTLIARRTRRPLPRAGVVAAPIFAVLLALLLPITVGAQMATRGTDWSGMCEYLKAHAHPGDTIIGSNYYQPAILWCYGPAISVNVPNAGSYSPDDLLAAGRPSWYVHIGPTPPDPALARLGYSEIPLEQIERPGTSHRDLRDTFPFRISENGSRLFRGPTVQPVAEVHFQDIDGDTVQPGWPDHASVYGSAAYVVNLALMTAGPRHLRLDYLAGPGRVTIVRMNGTEIARLGSAAVEAWSTADIAVPPASPSNVTIELLAAGERPSAFSGVGLIAGEPSAP